MQAHEQSHTYDQVEAAYYAMKAEAQEAPDGVLYYTGALTNLLMENGISKSKYSHITRFLKDMGCIERVRRGAGPTPSVWILWSEPTYENFEQVKLNPRARNDGQYRKSSTQKAEEQSINVLNERVNALERRLEDAGL